MITQIRAFVIPAAYSVLPAEMQSDRATALLLAIALQESDGTQRRQGGGGPARGFWQFEVAGVNGVMRHERTHAHLMQALQVLRYPKTSPARTLQAVLEHNDVLAAVLARLNLWWLPSALPDRLDEAEGWRQYLAAWQPGKPRPADWPENFARGWGMVTT